MNYAAACTLAVGVMAGSCLAQESSYFPGHVLILPQERGATAAVRAQVLEIGYKVRFETRLSGLLCIEVPVGTERAHADFLARRFPLARAVTLDWSGQGGMPPFYPTVPNDPLYPDQWYLNNTGQAIPDSTCGTPPVDGIPGVDVEIERAWEITQGDPTILVAVFDTGLDLSNPQFAGRIYPHAIDPFQTGGQDEYGHGTLVAGILANANDHNPPAVDGQGAGIDPNCTLVPVKVAGAQGINSLSATIFGLEEILSNPVFGGVRVINMSYQLFCPPEPSASEVYESLRDCIAALQFRDVMVVAISTNLGEGAADFWCPNRWSTVLTVAATTNLDARWNRPCNGFSSGTGNAVDVAAPGSGMLALNCPGCSQQYSQFGSGTSSAAPVVSGEIALLLARANVLGIDLTWQEI